ncbi:MAG: acyloxyacyl hydrolase [Saprospiraceae bacterium]
MSGAAVGSILLVKLLDKDEKLGYYQGHVGYFNGDGYDVFMQNFGIERVFAPWYSLRIEANIQEFSSDSYSTGGLGIRNYTRWSIFGKKKVSPYFEYGIGLFTAFQAFPEGGSNFTFNQTLALGLELKLDNRNKIRLDYNAIHHSNNGLFDTNPGFDGNGVTLSYSWFWKQK